MKAGKENKGDLFDKYMGYTAPDHFDSREEIIQYFSKDALETMFGPEYEHDEEEAQTVCEWVLEEFEEEVDK